VLFLNFTHAKDYLVIAINRRFYMASSIDWHSATQLLMVSAPDKESCIT